MSDHQKFRTNEDLERAVRALAHEFKTDTVIGSQAILMSWPDAPETMRGTPEVDAYPENAKIWEIEEAKKGDGPPVEASEHIHGLFGEGSLFHDTHGFYIDGGRGNCEASARLAYARDGSEFRRLRANGESGRPIAGRPHRFQAREAGRQRHAVCGIVSPRAAPRYQAYRGENRGDGP